ncbi:MAG TPA: glycosyltransferase family 87 protein, partial [Roseiflexaceae bacterium]|nr:glycosyltransferase family 87 protein [Roseiflexaceae bacterium]
LPLDVLPFVQRFAALAGVACLGLLLARLLAPPRPAAHHEDPKARGHEARSGPALSHLRAFLSNVDHATVRGEHLPIYMAVAWWMLPLFQLAMIWDAAPGVGLAPQTLWIGAGLLAALVGLGIWYALRRRGQLTSDARPTTNDQRTSDGAPGAEDHSLVAGDWLADRALVVLALAAAAHLAYNLWYAFTRSAPDFWILFRGAREWTRGGSLYDLTAVTTNHFGHVFKVPPFYGMLFVPFVTLDGLTVLFFHRVINTALILATALVWLRMWRLPLWSLAAAPLLILLNFRPLADTVAFGQIDLVLLLLLTLALWALRARDGALPAQAGAAPPTPDLLAGALVALGTLFKIYPAVLLAFFALKRRWAALAGFALGMLVFNGIALAVMGWEMHRVYLTQVAPNIGGTTSWVENQTISGFVARLSDSPREADIYANQGLRLLGTALSGAVVLLACALTLRPAKGDSTLFALQYGQFLLLMVLTVPAAWMHYQTLLFVPFAALLLHLRSHQVPLPRAALLATSFALIAYGNQWSFYDGTIMGALTIAGVSYKFYGMLLLGGLLAAEQLAGWRPLPLPRPAPRLERA